MEVCGMRHLKFFAQSVFLVAAFFAAIWLAYWVLLALGVEP